MSLEHHRPYVAMHGPWCFVLRTLCKTMERVVGFKALRGMTLIVLDANPQYLEEHPRYACHRATAEEFAALPEATKYESEQFLQGAIERGDWCYYMTDGQTIASYGWYSRSPVPAGLDTTIHHSPSYVYMYNGFTLRAYRGQHLHAYCMGHALLGAVQDGYTGLISYVEAHNAASMKSVRRLGYRTFGVIFRMKLAGRTFMFSTLGCKPYDFRLEASNN